MKKNKLELRMFGFVPYQLKGIQGGIQFGHAVVEYGRMVRDLPGLEDQYNDWADNWKTFIVYNGGTTNDREDYYGTMQLYRDQLKENGVTYAEFREPDLGDQLSGVVFIADERVFNFKDYPDLELDFGFQVSDLYDYDSSVKELDSIENKKGINDYLSWVNKIGGKKNLFLRKFKKQFKLAT